METTLFLLCPTDCLESKINKEFKGDNLFYSSLANNYSFCTNTVANLEELIINNDIKEIYFVLSTQNKIILDTMAGQSLSQIRGFQNFDHLVNKYKELSELFWNSTDTKRVIISYFNNHKIEQLKENFRSDINRLVRIKGKIFFKTENEFLNIYSKLVCLNHLNLN
jgi:hypothetical protein